MFIHFNGSTLSRANVGYNPFLCQLSPQGDRIWILYTCVLCYLLLLLLWNLAVLVFNIYMPLQSSFCTLHMEAYGCVYPDPHLLKDIRDLTSPRLKHLKNNFSHLPGSESEHEQIHQALKQPSSACCPQYFRLKNPSFSGSTGYWRVADGSCYPKGL